MCINLNLLFTFLCRLRQLKENCIQNKLNNLRIEWTDYWIYFTKSFSKTIVKVKLGT